MSHIQEHAAQINFFLGQQDTGRRLVSCDYGQMSEHNKLMKETKQHNQMRVQQFEAATKVIGSDVEQTELSEEEIMTKVEQVRLALHQKGYDPKLKQG
jgi:7-keto-8-aminopelargonate synthetase-like enzyme